MSKKYNEILGLLKSRGKEGITNVELSDIALRYGAYLGQMYKDGHTINSIHEGDGVYRYFYVSEPFNHVDKEPAIDILLKHIRNEGFVTASEIKEILEKTNITVKYKAGTHQSK